MSLTAEQVQIIKSTVPVLAQHGNAITRSFYSTLLHDNPSLNNIFNVTSNGVDRQAAALAGTLYAYAAHIDNLGALSPAVEKICQKHASLYVQPEQYAVVGEYLLRAMGEVLGSALTKDILDAWTAAYWQVANLMIATEKQLYSEANGWADWREFKIADKVKESEEITSFYLMPLDGKELPPFLPGQYTSVLVDVPTLGFQQPRHYSLSDAPNSARYRISVKREDAPNASLPSGCVSNVLHAEKAVGDVIKVSKARGEFYLDEADSKNPVVLLSAGVGLTPLVSMLNRLVARGSKQPISFIHGARSTSVRAFSRHVSTLAAQHPNVKYTSFVKNPLEEQDGEGRDYTHAGRLDLSKLDSVKDLFVSDSNTRYYVCGPGSFMAEMEKTLLGMGVAQDRIKMEIFSTGDIPKAT